MRDSLIYILLTCFTLLFASQSSGQADPNRIHSLVDSSDTDNMVLIQSFEVEATLDQTWEAYTTAKGWMNWAVPLADFDFRIGGLIQTSYNKDAKIGAPGTIRLHVVNYVPRKLLTLQAELTENFPAIMQKDAKDLYNVITFESISPNRMKIISYGIGYKQSQAYIELLEFFIKGNAYSYMNLISYLESGEPIKF